ncbi:MAG: YebC/PmpR family DNA-binding transcriptional regulator [Microgenomates group bacterium]
MSGHSKWANIKRQKQAADLKRGNLFSKLSRAITVAVLEGGKITDPEHNVKLRLAIEKAKAANMPKENIQRAIERGVGKGTEALKEVIIEAFGPSGVAFLVLAATDNINRTISQIRQVLDRGGGKLGSSGSVRYQFNRCGLATFSRSKVKEEAVLDFSEKIGAFDIDSDDNFFYVYFPFENLGRVKEAMAKEAVYDSVEIDFKPNSLIKIDDKETATKILALVDQLEELDDVQKVFANFEIKDDFLK